MPDIQKKHVGDQFELSTDNAAKKMDVETVKISRIYLAAITVNISAVACGTCISWSSPVGPKLRAINISDSPLNRPITANEEAWISSIIGIGAIITPFIAGPMADKIGRKKILLSSSLFFILGYLFMLLGTNFWVLLVGRLIKGFGIGFVMCVIPMYIGEISTDQTRGATGSLMSFLLVIGVLYVLCIGPFVSYIMLQLFCLLVPLVFGIAFFFMPESPFYYVAKGQRSAAVKALQFLRGQSSPAAVEAELQSIENFVAASMAQKCSILDVVKTAGNRKALFITLGLGFFQQMSGINVVIFNTQTIFENANLSMSSAIAAIIFGAVQVICMGLAPFVIHKIGRKILLLNSAFFTSTGLAAYAYFFYAKIELGDTRHIAWLPIPALVLYLVAFCFGFASLPWTISGEIFPPNIKSIAAALTASVCWGTGFVVTLAYPALDALGTHYVFGLFAAFCAAALFFVLFFVFETRGLSLAEIQNKLNFKGLENSMKI